MSKYFRVIGDKAYDYKFKQTENGWSFWLEHPDEESIFVGHVFNSVSYKRKYSAVCHHKPCEYGVVDGFASRLDAAQFMLGVCFPPEELASQRKQKFYDWLLKKQEEEKQKIEEELEKYKSKFGECFSG